MASARGLGQLLLHCLKTSPELVLDTKIPYCLIFNASLPKLKFKTYLILPLSILSPFVLFFLPSNYIPIVFFFS